jgi:addiction module HigA family antidote
MKTFANNMIPFSPTHPGEILKEEIEFKNISQRKLASQMGVSYSVLNEILNSKRSVNVEFALRIEAALGIEAEMLINMQSRYNLQIARTDKTFMQKLSEVRKISAIV